jgi:hypothetical protein
MGIKTVPSSGFRIPGWKKMVRGQRIEVKGDG